MKTKVTMLFTALLMCCTFFAKAQFLCGVTANFSHFPTSAGEQFVDTSLTVGGWNILAYQWSFGDGTYANIKDPVHHYNHTGTYTACLIVKGELPGSSLHCTDTICQTITVKCTLAGYINANISGNIVVYTASVGSGIPPYTYSWHFPGGNPTTSTTNPTTVVYPGPGTYQACLTVMDSSGCTIQVCKTVVIGGSSPCAGVHAGFGYNFLTANSIAFQSNVTNPSGSLYEWKMDGTPLTTPNPNTGYTATNIPVGVHHFCLYVYGPGSSKPCDSTCKTITVTSSGGCTLDAKFTFTPSSGGKVSFFGVSNPTGTVDYWSFGDGSTSNGTNPFHFYNSSGTYTVCHIVYMPGTTCVDSFCHQIQVNVGSAPCRSFFTFTKNSSNAATFTNYSTAAFADTISQYEWNFGDGSATSHQVNPSHTYPGAGPYVTCLTIHTVKGCTHTFCDTLYFGGSSGCQASFIDSIHCNTVFFYNTSFGANLKSTWIFGDGSTSKDKNPHHTYAGTGTYTVVLTITDSSTGCTSTAYKVIYVKPCGNDTLCGTVFNDDNGNGVKDTTETAVAGIEVHIDGFVLFTDSNGHYTKIVPTGQHYIYIMVPTGCRLTLPVGSFSSNGYYMIPYKGTTINHCGFDFGINCNTAQICGTVFYDANNNGVKDAGENGIPGATVSITGTGAYFAYTNANGEYCVTVPTGTYKVTAKSSVYSYCVVTPGMITVNATTKGTNYGANDFALYCPPGNCDLKILITPYTTVTPGFPAWYSVMVCNKGTSPASGSATLYYDKNITFDHATPGFVHDGSLHTLTWNFTPIFPGGCKYYMAYFNAPTGLTIGQQVFTLGTVFPDTTCNDANMANNVDTVHQKVTGSWDPNNKLAYTTNYVNPAYQVVSSLDADQRIEYVINFQNTGTAPAINVVVKDALSADLDLNSFEFLGSSHPCLVSRSGADLNFKFSNIMLPAEQDDEPNSHGYVTFAINAKNGLVAGHIITDPAAIYFDYNSPVITNDAAVTMLDITGVKNTGSGATVVVAPNPMSEYVNITVKSDNADGFTFRLMDITGKLMTEETVSGNSFRLNRNNLPAGVYMYEVLQNKQPVSRGKLIME